MCGMMGKRVRSGNEQSGVVVDRHRRVILVRLESSSLVICRDPGSLPDHRV